MWWKTTTRDQPADQAPVSRGAWGDGLVDQSLSDLWYPARWETVGDDELVFLLPTLGRWRPGTADLGPVDYLTRVLKSRALSVEAIIRQKRAAPTFSALSSSLSGVLTCLTAQDRGVAETGGDATRLEPMSSALGLEGHAGPADWLIAELTAIAYLDRMLADARVVERSATAAPIIDWPLTLSDVVAATIHARMNGAYVYPEFSFAHELLTAAAILGHLVEGRPALVSPALAACLAENLSADVSATKDLSTSVLQTYADAVGGSKYLRAQALWVCTKGSPGLIRPRAAVAPQGVSSTAWNGRLLQRLKAQLLTQPKAA